MILFKVYSRYLNGFHDKISNYQKKKNFMTKLHINCNWNRLSIIWLKGWRTKIFFKLSFSNFFLQLKKYEEWRKEKKQSLFNMRSQVTIALKAWYFRIKEPTLTLHQCFSNRVSRHICVSQKFSSVSQNK